MVVFYICLPLVMILIIKNIFKLFIQDSCIPELDIMFEIYLDLWLFPTVGVVQKGDKCMQNTTGLGASPNCTKGRSALACLYNTASSMSNNPAVKDTWPAHFSRLILRW